MSEHAEAASERIDEVLAIKNKQDGCDDLVLYHGGCWDGFCAAWLLWKRKPKAEFVPVNYGDDPPDVTGKHVFIVDFSYPRDVLTALHEAAESLVVLDHHKTAKDALEGLPFCTFDMNKSGARLTHEYCDKALDGVTSGIGSPPSWLVVYTEDRDLWRWEEPDSRAVNTWLRSHPLDFELWETFDAIDPDSDEFQTIIAEGKAILRSEQQTVNAKASQSHLVKVDPPCEVPTWWSNWRVANATTLMSETCQELAKETGVGCCWFELPSGERVYSLRALKDSNVDVSVIAKAFGGGGHPKASGFKATTHPWNVSVDSADCVTA